MEDDDEESDCLLIDEDRAEHEPGRPDATDTNTSENIQHNITPIANSEQTIRNNADTSPGNIVSLLKNFNLLQFRNNNPHIFDESNEEAQESIEGNAQIESNGARVFCKDFARIPYDDGSNLLTPEYLQNSELFAHLVGDMNTTRFLANVPSRDNGMNNEAFPPTTNSFTNNAYRAFPQTMPPNQYGNVDSPSGPFNTNRLDVIGNPSTSIPPNSGYGIQGKNMTLNIQKAQNLHFTMPHPGGPSSTAHGRDVPSNYNKSNASINNFVLPVMNMPRYGPVPVTPRQNQELYASDANRRQMYGHKLATPSANYGPNMGVCPYARCKGPHAPVNMGVTPPPAVPAGYVPSTHLCTCPGPCHVHRTGPLYPAAHSNNVTQPYFQTTTLRNSYGQVFNGNGTILRDGLYRVEDPFKYATYQQAYLTDMRRNSLATEQSIINTVSKQHMENNISATAIIQKPKVKAAPKATRAYAEMNTNLSNGDVINVDSSVNTITNFPVNTITNHDATTSWGNGCNMIPNWNAFGIKNTVKNKRQTKTPKKTTNAKTKAAKKTVRARAPTNKKDHSQLNNMNIATTQADKQNENLHQPAMEIRFPTEHGEIKLAYNISDVSVMQAPLSHECHLQKNSHNEEAKQVMPIHALINVVQTKNPCTDINSEKALIPGTTEAYPRQTGLNINTDQSQNPRMLTVQQIIMDAIDMAMQTNVQETEIHNVPEKVQTSVSNKVQTPNTQQAGMSINSENAQIPLIMEASQHQAEKSINSNTAQIDIKLQPKIQQASMNMTSNRVQTLISKEAPIKGQHTKMLTNEYLQKEIKSEMIITTANSRKNVKNYTMQPTIVDTIDMTMPTDVNQVKMCTSKETVQTSMNLEGSIQPANINTKVQSLRPLSPLNKNNLETQVTTRWGSETTIQQHSTCEIKVPALSSTEKEDADFYIDETVVESRPNSLKTVPDTMMEVSIQEDNTAVNNNIIYAQIPLTMKEYPQAERSMQINKNQSDVTTQTNIQQTKMDSNTETVQTSISLETFTQQASNNANIKVLALLTSVTQTTSNTCNLTYTTTSTESVIHNTESADLVSSSNNLNPITELANGVSRSNKIYDITQTQVTVQQHGAGNTVDHLSIDFLKSILDNANRNSTLQNTNIAHRKSSANQEKTDLALSGKEMKDHNENNKDTETIQNKYATITVSKGNISHKSENDEENEKLKIARQHLALYMQNKNKAVQSNSVQDNPQKRIDGEYDSIIALDLENRNISLASYEASSSEQRKSMAEPSCINNAVRSFADIKSLETRKRKIQDDREIKENYDSTIDESKKRYRRGANIKQKNNYTSCSQPVQKPAVKTGNQFHHTVIAKNQEKTKLIRKETNSTFPRCSVPFHHNEQKRLWDGNNRTKNTERSSADKRSLENTKRTNRYDRGTIKKRYTGGADIKQKKKYVNCSRQVPKSALKIGTKLHHTNIAKHKGKNEKETNSTSHDDLFWNFQLFQVTFFTYVHKRLQEEGHPKSAYTLSNEIYNLIHVSDDEDAIVDIKFRCPKCNRESIYSPHLFYDIEDVHNLDESDKTIHCQHCIRFRQTYITSLKRFIKRNTTQSSYIRANSGGTHSTDIGQIVDRKKIDTESNVNNTKIDDRTINSSKELKTQSAFIHTQSDITHSTDIDEIANQPKIDYDHIEEQLSIITNGVPSFPTKAKIDAQNNHNNTNFFVKIPCNMLKPSTVDSLIKLKHNTSIEYKSTLNIATNDIDHKVKNFVIDREEQKIVSVQTATSTSNPRDKNLNTAINENDGNVENNKDNPVKIHADINTNTETSRKVIIPNNVETTSSINAKVPKINENNNNANVKNSVKSATCRLTELSNKVMNAAKIVNEDTKMNGISRKERKRLSAETTTDTNVQMCERTNTGINNNHEKNNHMNPETKKKNHDDNANSPDVEPNPKKSNDNVQKNTDLRKNTYTATYTVSKGTDKNNRIRIKLLNIFGELDEADLQKTNDNEEENARRGGEIEDDTKSCSESNDKDDNETDDEVNDTSEAIDKSFNTLKNSFSEKPELPQLHISGKTEGKRLNKPKNYATIKDEYSYKCHVCTAMFSYLRVYYTHMSNHGIHKKRIPKECVYKKCVICDLKTVQAIAFNSHIRTCHEDTYRSKN